MFRLSDLSPGDLVKDPDTKYYTLPIEWQVLEHGHDGVGLTTLVSKDILCLRGFDSPEPNNSNTQRQTYGNARYSVSNLRQWLNSDMDKGEWYSPQHEADALFPSNYYNYYGNMKGFLKNFSSGLKPLLQMVPHITQLSSTDGGGSENVYDKVFLLSLTELGFNVTGRNQEGTIYEWYADSSTRQNKRKKYLTAKAYSNAQYKNGLSLDTPAKWWTRTCYTDKYPGATCNITDTGAYASSYAYSCTNVGLVPAIVIPSATKVYQAPDLDGVYIFNLTPRTNFLIDLGRLKNYTENRISPLIDGAESLSAAGSEINLEQASTIINSHDKTAFKIFNILSALTEENLIDKSRLKNTRFINATDTTLYTINKGSYDSESECVNA